MCQIVVKPANITLTRRDIAMGWQHNSDGAGFMYAENGKLILKKGYLKLSPLWKDLRTVMDKELVIHFRTGTSGKKDESNTHPFLVNDNLGFCHNGILRAYAETDLVKNENHSDSSAFVELLLKKLPSDFLDNDGISWLVEAYAIEHSSKFVFMDNLGRVTIMNKKAGWDTDGIWKSSHGGVRGNTVYTKNQYGNWACGGGYDYDYDEKNWPLTKKEDANDVITESTIVNPKDIISIGRCDVCGTCIDGKNLLRIDNEDWCPICVVSNLGELGETEYNEQIIRAVLICQDVLHRAGRGNYREDKCATCGKTMPPKFSFWHYQSVYCIKCFPTIALEDILYKDLSVDESEVSNEVLNTTVD